MLGTPLPSELSGIVETRPVTVDRSLFYLVGGALSWLVSKEPLEQAGTLTVDEARLALSDMLWNFYQEVIPVSGIPIGGIMNWPNGTAPDGYLFCDGTEYLRTDYPDLFDILGTPFRVDADHFVTPNMVGNFVRGANNGTYPINQTGGAGTVTLTTNQLPQHSHQQRASNGTNLLMANGATSSNVGQVPAAVTRDAGNPQPLMTSPVGGNDPHENLPPFRALMFIIRST